MFVGVGAGLERPQSNMSYNLSRDPGEPRQIKSELCSPDVEALPGRANFQIQMHSVTHCIKGGGITYSVPVWDFKSI